MHLYCLLVIPRGVEEFMFCCFISSKSSINRLTYLSSVFVVDVRDGVGCDGMGWDGMGCDGMRVVVSLVSVACSTAERCYM